ncbi:hypothetical protein HMPREF9440_01128 [Sutterella parvirubra YIT 11816]|uniref:Uncharacterized protein n=1 Tax=Sutterella parvirubra YIT 11816 TaxID=762967 RepID=H3KEG4_9BURK|nr:hypothetical protein HMPREF9440_01128 [Sutterella parvirubra YIT 11816]
MVVSGDRASRPARFPNVPFPLAPNPLGFNCFQGIRADRTLRNER